MTTRRFTIDCEFNGHGGDIFSLALINEEGHGLYLCDCDPPANMDPWVAENVWPLVKIKLPVGRTVAYPKDFAHFAKGFIGKVDHLILVADSPVDIGRFCEMLSTNDEGGWAPNPYERITFEVHNVDCYPTDLPGAVQHNAYWDALALHHKLFVQ